MERLTEHHVNKTLGAYMVCSGACIKEDFDCTLCENLNKIVNTLAAYEDTGLEPEDIDALQKRERGLAEMLVNVSCGCVVPYTRLAELTQAEKDGRLVVLPPNVPLTLDELREMDGEPVWGAFSEGSGRYMIIQWHNSEFFKTFECGFLLLEEYGKTWLAYRRKPEEVGTCQKTSSLSG